MGHKPRKSQQSRRIDEELVSIDALRHALVSYCGCGLVQTEAQADDPPDFIIRVDDVSFPVEITSIVSNEGYYARCLHFTHFVREVAYEQGVLNGRYVLSVRRAPRIPSHFSRDGERLRDSVIAFMQSTQQDEASEELILFDERSGQISIKKCSLHKDDLDFFVTSEAKWESQIQDELGGLICERVRNKKLKLQQKGIVDSTAILVLYDAFGYASSSDAFAAIQQINERKWFHSIFWATAFGSRRNSMYPDEPGRYGVFLHSDNPRWFRVGSAHLSQDELG